MFVALALVSIAIYLTGSPASHQMRQVPGVSLDVIRNHSNAADFAFTGVEVLGAFSLALLVKFWRRAVVPARLSDAILVLALIVFGLFIWTAGLGGKIRHPEIGGADIVSKVRRAANEVVIRPFGAG